MLNAGSLKAIVLAYADAPPNLVAAPRPRRSGASQTAWLQAIGAGGAAVPQVDPAPADGESCGGRLSGLRVRQLARRRPGRDHEAEEQAGTRVRLPGGKS